MRNFSHYWSVARCTAGMAILATVFVLAQGLLYVHELAQGQRQESGEA